MDQTESTRPGKTDSDAAATVSGVSVSQQVKFMDVASTLRLNKRKFITVFLVVVATLNVVALAREPDVPLYKTKALVVASELAIRVDGLPRTAVAIFNGGTVARLAANYAGTGISPDDLIPAIVDISPVEGTTVLEIEAIHPDPELAALYANAAGRALAEEMNRIGPGLGSFALQVEAPIVETPLEVSRLPNIVFSVVAGALLVAGLAALVGFLQASDRNVPFFKGPARPTSRPTETPEPEQDIIGTVKMGSQPAIPAPERPVEQPAVASPHTARPAIERSITPPPPPRPEPQTTPSIASGEEIDAFEPLVTPLEKIAQPSPLHPLLFVDEEAAHVLEIVEGVDAVFAARLVAAGITSLEELGTADGKWLSDAIEVRRDIVVDWISQASRLHAQEANSDDDTIDESEPQPDLASGLTDIPTSDDLPTQSDEGSSAARGAPPLAPAGSTNGYRKPPPGRRDMANAGDDNLTLRSIRGIGAVFAERLTTVGIATVEDLASANASSLAYTMEVRYGTVADWIKQARALSSSPDEES
ncbi:MAG: helix-hairpin-helix domain-containing protein [Acidimicrobiia bacterium]|nr:helix-hairpin-helix domain-containing protein [Acidimicrobiia bacterium]